MSSEMRKCPFCGDYGAEVAESAVPSIKGGHKRAVYCNGCFCEGPTADTDEAAIAAWNRRAILMKSAEENKDSALLARTEAGADGAAMLVRDVCEMAPADPDAPDTVCIRVSDLTRIAEQYTHPQDASGGADAAYAILDRLTTTRESCLQLAKVIYRELDKVEKLLDEAVEKCAAMQAKEAK